MQKSQGCLFLLSGICGLAALERWMLPVFAEHEAPLRPKADEEEEELRHELGGEAVEVEHEDEGGNQGKAFHAPYTSFLIKCGSERPLLG